MQKSALYSVLFFLLIYSCKSKEFIAIEDVEMYSFDATNISDDQAKRFANYISNPREIIFSDDNLPNILVINKKMIKKELMQSVLDTIHMKNYFIDINKNIRSMIMISK